MALPYDWRWRLLARLLAPVTGANVTALSLWAASEGTPGFWNNWLATTMACCGGQMVNTVGVMAYPTLDSGVEATYRTLLGGAYGDIRAALQDGSDIRRIYQAINASPWCGGCQNGLYPIVLARLVGPAEPGKTWESQPATVPDPTQPPDIDWTAYVRAHANSMQVAAGAVNGLQSTLNNIFRVSTPKQWRP